MAFHMIFFILMLLIFSLLFYFACVIMGVEIRSRGDEHGCSRAGSAVGLCAMAYGCGGVKQVFQDLISGYEFYMNYVDNLNSTDKRARRNNAAGGYYINLSGRQGQGLLQ